MCVLGGAARTDSKAAPSKPGPPSSWELGVAVAPVGRLVVYSVGMGLSSATRLESSAPLASFVNSFHSFSVVFTLTVSSVAFLMLKEASSSTCGRPVREWAAAGGREARGLPPLRCRRNGRGKKLCFHLELGSPLAWSGL